MTIQEEILNTFAHSFNFGALTGFIPTDTVHVVETELAVVFPKLPVRLGGFQMQSES